MPATPLPSTGDSAGPPATCDTQDMLMLHTVLRVSLACAVADGDRPRTDIEKAVLEGAAAETGCPSASPTSERRADSGRPASRMSVVFVEWQECRSLLFPVRRS